MNNNIMLLPIFLHLSEQNAKAFQTKGYCCYYNPPMCPFGPNLIEVVSVRGGLSPAHCVHNRIKVIDVWKLGQVLT